MTTMENYDNPPAGSSGTEVADLDEHRQTQQQPRHAEAQTDEARQRRPVGRLAFRNRQGVKIGIITHAVDDEMPQPDGVPAAPPDLSGKIGQDDLADAFAYQYGHSLKYCNQSGSWLEWDLTYWRPEKTLLPYDLIRRIGKEAQARDPEQTQRLQSGDWGGAERAAKSSRAHAVRISDLDSDPMLLATPGGTVDLRRGDMRNSDPSDMLTKRTAVTPDFGTDPAHWLDFLDATFEKDDEKIAYVQRLLGYMLTGRIDEHVLVMCYGTGANGKSTFLNTFRRIMGDYAKVAPAAAFCDANGERHPTDIAMLRGARFALAQELDAGQRLAEAKVKSLTGGDPITARFMRGDFFEYEPEFKLVIASNHMPAIQNVDEAIRRRVHVLRFDVTIPEHRRDPELPAKLWREAPAILAWAIQGALDWQEEGLSPPPAVRDASETYLADCDHIGRFIDECCERNARSKVAVGILYDSYKEWCQQHDETPQGRKAFAAVMEAKGFQRKRAASGYAFAGLQRSLAAPEPF